MEGSINSYEGMNKDLGYDIIPSNLYIDAKDIRITTVSGESQGSFTNMKGNTEFFTFPTSGIYGTFPSTVSWTSNNAEVIGYTTIRNRIILFVADDSNTKGWIYDVQYDPSTRAILSGFPKLVLYGANLGFKKANPIEALGRYESPDIQRVYWTDYNNQLRSYNIELTPNVGNTELINFHPDVIYNTPLLVGIFSGGNLKVGSYQIAYKLRTQDGKETLISPPSELIHITTSPETLTGTSKYTGDVATAVTNKSIKVSINTSSYNNFEQIDIYLIYYNIASGTPSVQYVETNTVIVGTMEFLITGTESGITEVELADFTTRTYPFYTAKTITQKDSNLVISNLKASTFSASERIAELGETFNFKLLRYDSSSTACTDEFNQEYNIDAHWLQDWHANQQFKYLKNGTTLGAMSENPSATSGNNLEITFHLEPMTIDTNNGPTAAEAGVADTWNFPDPLIPHDLNDGYGVRANTTFSNHASPFLSGVLRGYKRGETYRFGIIFYNKQGECSFVEHIGDIKFPDISDTTDVLNTNGQYTFDISNDYLSSAANQIIGYNLGFNLTIDFSSCLNFYNEITSYQIVRVDRTIDDARRLTSGLVKTFSNYPSGPPAANVNFDLRIPVTTGDPILHLDSGQDQMVATFNALDVSGQIQSNAPKFGDFIAYHSPEVSYNYQNIPSIISSIPNACLLVTGAYVTQTATSDTENLSAAKLSINTYNNTKKLIFNVPINVPSTEYVKIWSTNKQYTKMDDSTDLIYTSVMGPFYAAGSNYFLRNYHITVNDPDGTYNDPQLPGVHSSNDYEFCKGATGIFGKISKLEYDPITGDPITITSNEDNWDNDYVRPAVGTLTDHIPLVDTLLPKSEIYGGFTQSALASNIFRIASPVIKKNYQSPIIFGGDTFINMATFQSTCVDLNEDIYEQAAGGGGTYYAYAYATSRSQTLVYPTESSFNIELDYGASTKRGIAYTVTVGTTVTEKGILRQEVNNSYYGYARSTDMYQQNDVFSITNQDLTFAVKPTNLIIANRNDIRSRLSNTKYNGETVDSWTKFQTNRFYDVDDYGPINKIINWKDIVYFFQDRGVGMLAINRAAINSTSDGTPLQLGTTLGFSKHQYLSKEHGSIHQWAVKTTDTGMYYFDAINRKIFMLAGDGNTPITELLGMHSWMQQLSQYIFTTKDNGGDNPILQKGVHIGKDKINDEVIFTFLDGATQYSLVFDELAKKFSSFHSPTPKIWIDNGDILLTNWPAVGVTNKPVKLYTHNTGDYGKFYGVVKEAELSIVVNSKGDYNKVLRTIEFNSIVRDNSKIIDRTKTITAFRIYNQYQDTNKVLFTADRFKRKFDKWRLKIPRNQLSTSQQDRLRSTYFIVTLYFDNTYNKELIMNHLLSYYDIQVF